MSFLNNIKSVSENLPTLLEKLGKVETSNANTLAEIKKIETKLTTMFTETQKQNDDIKAKLPVDATTAAKGIVKLSSIEALDKDDNAVITAGMLKHIIKNIHEYIPEATQEKAGLVKLATKKDVEDGVDKPITINNLKSLKIPLDATTFRLKGNTKQGLQYIIDKLNDTEATINVFGMLTVKPNVLTTVYFPKPIAIITAGVSINPVHNTNGKIELETINTELIEFKYVTTDTEKVDISINITACLLSDSVVGLVTADVLDNNKLKIKWSNT